MKKILFLGQVKNIEFASRWRKELTPKAVTQGKRLSYYISQDGKTKDIENAITNHKYNAKGHRDRVGISKVSNDPLLKSRSARNDETRNKNKLFKNKQKTIKTPRSKVERFAKLYSDNNISNSTIKEGDKLAELVRERIREKNLLKEANEKIDNTVKSFNDKVKAPSNVVNSPPKNSVSEVIKPKASNTLLTPKKSSLSKAGLVGAGLLTAGAIGYTIYRKTRKDKGKKRGRYAK